MRVVGRVGRLGALGAALATVLVVTAAAGPAFAASPASDRDDGPRPLLEQVKERTEKFRDLTTAENAGYTKFFVCTANEPVGAMGQHFVNGKLAGDATVDPFHPEALVYEPLKNGGYRLVALEYIAFKAIWDASNAAPPELFGHTFGLVKTPNIFGLPDFYELHVWLFKHNPDGMFFEWNPRVECPPGT